MFGPRPASGRPDAGLLAALRVELAAAPDTPCVDVQPIVLVFGPTVRPMPLDSIADLFPGHAVSRNPDGSVTVRLPAPRTEPEAA